MKLLFIAGGAVLGFMAATPLCQKYTMSTGSAGPGNVCANAGVGIPTANLLGAAAGAFIGSMLGGR